MTPDEAKQKAAEIVSAQRYEGDNYFFISDLDCIMRAHPLRKKLIGTSVADLEDAHDLKVQKLSGLKLSELKSVPTEI